MGKPSKAVREKVRGALSGIDPEQGVTCKFLKRLLGSYRGAPIIRDLVTTGIIETVPGSGRRHYRLPIKTP